MPDVSPTEAQISGLTTLVGIVVASVHLIAGGALTLAAWRVGRRLGGPWRAAIWAPILAVPMPVCGVAVTVLLLVRAFGQVGEVDAARRSIVLAEGISGAMNATASGVVLAWTMYVVTAVALAIGHLRRAPG